MVNRNHNFPPADAPSCNFCADSGFHQWEGEWSFCRCKAGIAAKARDPVACDDMNFAVKRMEEKIK